MSNTNRGPELVSWWQAAYERHRLQVELAAVQVLAPAQGNEIGLGIDRRDVAWLAQGDAESLALTDRVRGGTAVLADERAVDIDQRTSLLTPAGTVTQCRPVVTTRDEADLLALRLLGRDQAVAPRNVAHLRLCQ